MDKNINTIFVNHAEFQISRENMSHSDIWMMWDIPDYVLQMYGAYAMKSLQSLSRELKLKMSVESLSNNL